MRSAGERAKCFMQKEHGVDSIDVIDLSASFDDSWCSRKCTANRGIVSAIAEISSQVIDVSYNTAAVQIFYY